MSLDQWLRVIQIIAVIATTGLSFWLWRRSKDDERVKALEQDVSEARGRDETRRREQSDMHTRVSVLEAQMRQMPTHDDLRKIWERLNSLGSTISAIDERSEQTLDSVRSLQTYLMENK